MKHILACLALLTVGPAFAAPVTEQALRRHIDVLASDAYGGREPGTPGAAMAVAYIGREFALAGLKPGARDGSWYQPVTLVERTAAGSRAAWDVGGRDHAAGEVMLFGASPYEALAGEVRFAGFAAEPDDTDLRGAIVLVRGGQAKGRALPDAEIRIAALARRGARAVIFVAPAQVPWRRLEKTNTALAGDVEAGPRVTGFISEAAFRRLFGRGDELWREADRGADRMSPPLGHATLDVTTAVRRYVSRNVIGRVAGSGTSGEAIVLTAHWDHLGLCGPVGAKDRICNGAVDNASGIASLIEAGRLLAAGPPPVRDILLVATTAEEKSKLGAEAFALDPPVPVSKIAAALNIDCPAIGPRGLPVAMIGRGVYPALDVVVDDVARRLGRPVDDDREANVMLQRQDGWALGQRGVRSVMVGGSFSDMARLETYLSGPYHTAADDPGSDIPLGGAAEDTDLVAAVALAFADPARLAMAEGGK